MTRSNRSLDAGTSTLNFCFCSRETPASVRLRRFSDHITVFKQTNSMSIKGMPEMRR